MEIYSNNWENILVVYKDTAYQIIWGIYRDIPALGTQMNRESDTISRVPDFIADAILSRLDVIYSLRGENNQFINHDNLYKAITQLKEQYPEIDNPADYVFVNKSSSY